MASAAVYNAWKLAGSPPGTLAGLTLKVTLHTSTYVPNIDTHAFFDDLTAEASSGGGYTTGGETLTGLSAAINTGSDFAYLHCDPISWAALTKTFRYAVFRVDTGTPSTSRLIGYIDFGADQVLAGIPFVITPTADASGGLLKAA